MPATVFTTFAEVQNALTTFVNNNNITLGPPHGNIWENGDTPDQQYNNFVNGDAIKNYPILQKRNGKASNIILALSGFAPFDGSTFPQMPVNGPYLDQDTITAISNWIDAGANQ